jgi:putative transposase
LTQGVDVGRISPYNRGMKLILQIQLLPDTEAAAKMKAAIERFNEAATWLAGVAFEKEITRAFNLHHVAYRDIREKFGLPADMAVRCLAQVCEAYKRDRSVRPKFRKHAAVPFGMGKNISFKGPDRVSIGTLAGRVVIPFLMGKYQAERFQLRKGQSDLVLRKDGKWFLLITVDVPDGAPIPTTDFLGVDMGICNLASDSDGNRCSGEDVEKVRSKHNARRKALGKAAGGKRRKGKRPKAIRRAQRRRADKEARYRRDINHCISKAIVRTAERSARGIALEDLGGIRERVKARGGDARNRLGGWGFAQLRTFIEYKAKIAGVPVVAVDPRNTSRECSACGHTAKGNRPSQSEFRCRSCGLALHADINAARVIRARAVVNRLQVAEQHGAMLQA